MTDVAAIDRLRSLVARLLEREDDADGAWFSTALLEYETGARFGVTFDQALGKLCTGGCS